LALVLGLGLKTYLPILPANPNAFGWEYGFIAQNLVEGRGFSGPFGPSAEPTAWMPPLFPLIVAAVFKAFRVFTPLSAQVLISMQALWVWMSLWLLLGLLKTRTQRILMSAFFFFYLWLNWMTLLLEFHDIGFTMLLSVVALTALKRLPEGARVLPIATAVVLPLSNPVLAIAYALIAMFCRTKPKTVIAIWLAMLCSVSVWTVRNFEAMGVFVPLKSNLFFELYQANVADNDGVPTTTTFVLYHPVTGFDDVKRRYDSEGEVRFLSGYRTRFLSALAKDPKTSLRKLLTRAFNALVYLRPVNDLVWDYSQDFTQPFLDKLVARRLICPRTSPLIWCCIDLSEAAFLREIQDFEYHEKERALSSRREAIKRLNRWDQSWKMRTWSLSHALIPFLAIVLGLSRGKSRDCPLFRKACFLYLLLLAPYIVISHYMRYQVPLMGLSALILSLALAPDCEERELGE